MEAPTFDGKSLSVTDVLIQFDIVARNNEWNNREKARRLAGALRKDSVEILSILGRRATSYSVLVRALLKRFSPSGQETKYARKYDKCKESLPKFGQALQRLSRQAYPDSSMSQRLLCHLFTRGLPKKCGSTFS